MYGIVYTQSARKALKRLKRSGSFPKESFSSLLALLISSQQLPLHFKNHNLHGELSAARECHLGFNLLIIYKRNEVLGVVTIENIGTHQELFDE